MIDTRIKFRHLQCFLEAARQGSIVRAAEALSVSQPAVSKTLKELEESLGARLFDRSKKGVRLTRFGEIFMRHAAASVMALHQGIDSVSRAQSKGGYIVSAGVLPNVAARLMPRALNLFKQTALETVVRVSTGSNASLLAQLRLGDLDVVVGRLVEPDQMTGLAFEHIYSEPMTLVVRAGHPLSAAEPFDLAALSRFPASLPPEGTVIRKEVDRFLIANGIRLPSDQVETISVTFGRAYALASDAVWAVPRGAIDGDIAAGTLVELPIDRSAMMGSIGITTRSDIAPSPLAELLMNTIREVAGGFRAQAG
ncbi:pca operon transcription factor PcaQ [Breoghania sp. L-A4]|uniref:pca operon transcription factor PcaQ n=1 Tax=Breoghania sp. L-A4 TaxID=2304600 RepID=UPI000E358499|nr:pca operon transcription factor PcaQ [Breoghania sp. L-A4]AXS40298.1 pca operon transcription factor PcaQ [Breoghania sp. L-A4]